MKILRYLEEKGNVAFAAVDRQGVAHSIVQADNKLELLDEQVDVRSHLAPVDLKSIYGVALNYRDHAQETGKPLPEKPVIFMKALSSLAHPNGSIILPRARRSDKVDFEGELVVIIGETCKNVKRADALNYVSGYTCANDVSARDWQYDWGGGQYCDAKSFDTFCPMGPWLVTADEIPDPSNLAIKTVLNGEVVQESNTRELIFDIPALIEFLSGSTTLLSGTAILTGTPGGVGVARKPQLFLKPGDEIYVEIEGIGKLKNTVVEEEFEV
tara:strand:- start:856 stop:1665 length:810 start_codon:yes stop_codon:yes gene_type:complete